MEIVTITEARNNFKELFDKVVYGHEEIILHRKGKESVVMISLEEYNALKETHYLLSNPANAAHLKRSIEQLKQGNVIKKEIKDL